MNTFLQDNYKPTETKSNYFRFQDGDNTIRIISSAVTGWVYFNKDNKPVRSKEQFEDLPTDIKDGGKIKEFWSFVIWNYATESIQIMEITQKTIMSQILALINNPKWKDVKSFDITITRTGKSLETSYSVIPEPKTDVPELAQAQYENSSIDLEQLFVGGNPFTL